MRYGISGPGCQCSMEQLAFNAYAYSQQRIEDFITLLSASVNPNDPETQRAAAIAADLDLNTLSSAEIDYIEREVAKRW